MHFKTSSVPFHPMERDGAASGGDETDPVRQSWTSRIEMGAYPEYTNAISLGVTSSTSSTIKLSDFRNEEYFLAVIVVESVLRMNPARSMFWSVLICEWPYVCTISRR